MDKVDKLSQQVDALQTEHNHAIRTLAGMEPVFKALLDQQKKTDKKLDKIENALTALAVQQEQIVTINGQISALFKKYDSAFAPGGTVDLIKTHQASCPRKNLEDRVTEIKVDLEKRATEHKSDAQEDIAAVDNRVKSRVKELWFGMGLLVTLVGVLKLFG